MKRPFVCFFGSSLLTILFASATSAKETHAVFKSTDGGRSWGRSDQGIPRNSRVNAFGSLDETVFAGGDSGIYISRNEGRSWEPAEGAAMTSGRVTSFAAAAGILFAGADGVGLLTSADGGDSWTANTTIPVRKVRCLLVVDESLFAGTDADGVYASHDGGVTWASLEHGFPSQAQVFAMSMAGGRLFAGLYSKGLYAWNRQESQWKKAGAVSPLVLTSLDGTLVAGHNPGGLYWSKDLGATWKKGVARTLGEFTPESRRDSGELSAEAPVWELASNEKTVFAGASSGVYFSEDQGRTWSRARTGLPTESPAVSFLPKRNYVLAGVTIPSGSAK